MRLTVLLSVAGLLCGCLPGEEDVAKRYNDINQRAHIQNTGNSLMQAAHNMVGYMTADSMKLKAPLDQIPITDLGTAENNVVPKDPPGVKVVTCDTNMFGAAAYFTEQPKGVPPLSLVGETMRASLTKRFGGQSVGWHSKGESIMPPLWADAGCDSNLEGIADYSPIFVAGFVYNGDEHGRMVLPDPALATQPEIKREVTLPCPGGYHGVIMRTQSCKLKSGESDEVEEVTFVTNVHQRGGETQSAGHELQAVRKKKIWDCDPAVGANLTAKAEEIAHFCRDPSQDMTKPAENIIQVDLADLKRTRETKSDHFYKVTCREGSEGQGTCTGQHYTPPAGWTLKCDHEPQDPRYVVNPTFEAGGQSGLKPLIDWSSGLITPGGTESDCGRGWTGDIKWEYQLRQCYLYSPEGVIAPEQPKTIYWMGQVAMKCKREPQAGENWIAECPVGVGDIFIKKRYTMNNYMALQPETYEKGKVSRGGAFTGMADDKTEERLQKEEFQDTARLCGEIGSPNWNECNQKTASALRAASSDKAFADNIAAAIGSPAMSSMPVACNTEGQTCKSMGDVKHLIILVDRSKSMSGGGGRVVYDKPTCFTLIQDYFVAGDNRTQACAILNNFEPQYESYTPVDCNGLPPSEQQTCHADNNNWDNRFTEETNTRADTLGAQLASLARTNQNMILGWDEVLKFGYKCDSNWSAGGQCRRGEPEGPQDSCIGVCDSQRFDQGMSSIDAVNEYITGLIVPSLKKGVKVTYGQIRNKMDWFPFPKNVPDYRIFTHTMCQDITITIPVIINGKKEWKTYSFDCNLPNDQREIRDKIGSDSARYGTPLYGALVDTLNNAQREGATGDGTYVMIISDGYPTDSRRDGITGVCAGSKPIYKYIQERMPGAVINMLLMASDAKLQSECSNVRSAAGWNFVDSKDVNALSNFMNTKFPVYMPELGTPMCREYFKTNNIVGYIYSE